MGYQGRLMAVEPAIFRAVDADELESELNAFLSPILARKITGFQADTIRNTPSQRDNLYVVMTTDDNGASVITTPYQLQMFQTFSDEALVTLINEFVAANPTYWFSPAFSINRPDAVDPVKRILGGLFYNVTYADGLANWAVGGAGGGGGGAPSGPAGGDLSGTYPNPIVGPRTTGQFSVACPVGLTVVDTAAIASFRDVLWELALYRDSDGEFYAESRRAHQVGGVPYDESYGQVLSAGFDSLLVTVSVDISAGNFRLLVNNADSAFTARVRRRTFAV